MSEFTTADALAALRYRAALADKRGDKGEAQDLRAVDAELVRVSSALREALRCQRDHECVLDRGHDNGCCPEPYDPLDQVGP